MNSESIGRLDWAAVAAELDGEGHALLPGLLGATLAGQLARGEMSADPWHAMFHRHLARIANRWNATLGIEGRYPVERDADPGPPQARLSRLRAGEYVPLLARGDGAPVFPLQIVALLSEPGVDFVGGEFVMTEQRPRMQSRAMVLPLRLGDAAIIATASRPHRGTRGHYRVNLKHGISRVHQGERIGLELAFHDAPIAL